MDLIFIFARKILRAGSGGRRLLFVASCASMTLLACDSQSTRQPEAPGGVSPALAQAAIERGRTLVTAGGCHDCHTPKKLGANGPEPDMTRMLSGHSETEGVPKPYAPATGTPWTIATVDGLTAWSGPWGVSFATNLTPDSLTGLRSGVWTEELFVKALKTGKHMGTARPILPPMSWPMYSQFERG
jgi:hypothetical protein